MLRDQSAAGNTGGGSLYCGGLGHGRPRGRKVDCRPSRFAVYSWHEASPNGEPPGRSPSARGQSAKCQWLGITQHAKTRMGDRDFACPITSSSASKSRGLPKMRFRPTPRFSTPEASPPLETRHRRGMTRKLPFPAGSVKIKTPDTPLSPDLTNPYLTWIAAVDSVLQCRTKKPHFSFPPIGD